MSTHEESSANTTSDAAPTKEEVFAAASKETNVKSQKSVESQAKPVKNEQNLEPVSSSEGETSLTTQLAAPPPSVATEESQQSVKEPQEKDAENEQLEDKPKPQEISSQNEDVTTPQLLAPPPTEASETIPTTETPILTEDKDLKEEIIDNKETIEITEVKASGSEVQANEPKVDQEAEETEEGDNNLIELAQEIIYGLINNIIKAAPSNQTKLKPITDDLYVELSEKDQITAFIEATIGALADDIAMGAREYISHDENYFWMTYFFLQYCGFRIFLDNIDVTLSQGQSAKEVAQIIVELIDRVAENADYMHSDSDLPEHVAKNIIWQILNSNKMMRRYEDKGVDYCMAGDILDDIIEAAMADQIVSAEPEIKLQIKEEPLTIKSDSSLYKEPEVCREYAGIFHVAEHFISTIIDESKEIAARTHAWSGFSMNRSVADGKVSGEKEQKMPNRLSESEKRKSSGIPRPWKHCSIEQFTIKDGTRILMDIINKWRENFTESWAYSMKYLMAQSDCCSDYYFYEAVFGLPTPMYPVPQATCSLIFTIEVSRVKPPVCGVNISYKIEGSGYVFLPEDYEFQEGWLLNVIDGKLLLFSKIRF